MYEFNYHQPTSLDEVAQLLGANEEAKIVAGGMTIVPTLKFRLAKPSDLIDLVKIPLLRGITDAGDALVIGAMTRHAEVEIDLETGQVAVVNFTASDDFGRIINPLIVAGQVHGGLAQGIGQALLEGCVYDKASGQLMTGSYMDYAMPRADDLPPFELSTNTTLCTHNPLGVKGCGEAGAIGAPAAITNALVDALKPLGVRHLDMPATPEKLWRTIQQNRTPLAAE